MGSRTKSCTTMRGLSHRKVVSDRDMGIPLMLLMLCSSVKPPLCKMLSMIPSTLRTLVVAVGKLGYLVSKSSV